MGDKDEIILIIFNTYFPKPKSKPTNFFWKTLHDAWFKENNLPLILCYNITWINGWYSTL